MASEVPTNLQDHIILTFADYIHIYLNTSTVSYNIIK